MSKLESHSTGIGDHPALVVVDMCKAFIDSSSPLGFECDELIQANINLINKFRLNKLPVIFTTTIYRNASEASVFRSKIPALNILEPESDAINFIDDLAPLKDEILIEKKFASAFFQTTLTDSLLKIQADSVVICGVTTSGCVRATAVDSLQNNFPTTIAEDCVGDRDLDAHKANLYDLQSKYADVIHSNLIS
ncbi:isochorismatase family protein [Gammaproteobacteria bacterium]|nr:isochorismatase family protein [Gammaproteobacteria bacterium]MDA8799237.1 isochorismatase family protein [Gammaproteobacteria bacterium]MDC0919483.1 isochorismatase family protein [Gammaproteobacteria bacterium]